MNKTTKDFENIILNKIPRLKILVIGDIILDRYIIGSVDRTSPEAPVPIVKAEEEHFILGGAANVAHNLSVAGVSTSLIGFLGKDSYAKTVGSLLKHKSIDGNHMVIDETRPTILKTRVMSGGQQLIRIDNEKVHSPTREKQKELLRRCREALKKHDGIIFSDYAKGILTHELLSLLIEEARKKDIPIFVDPKGKDFTKYKGVHCLTPNLKETQEATGITVSDDTTLLEAGTLLLKTLKVQCLAITRGVQGVVVFQPRRNADFIAGHRREVYDITGAGDTFISYMTAGYCAGFSFSEAARLGNYAAAITVSKLGVATVSPDELVSFIRGEQYGSKRVDLPGLTQIVRSLKSKGKKIVFTNGCFDLLHTGHIKFLEQARNLGDCLIVALNSDASVRRLKGAPRPVISEKDRADFLAALHFVDYVIVFKEDNPLKLIQSIQPDILVKGKNLKPDDVVGRDLVMSYGGKVALLPFFSALSTEQIIKAIRNE